MTRRTPSAKELQGYFRMKLQRWHTEYFFGNIERVNKSILKKFSHRPLAELLSQKALKLQSNQSKKISFATICSVC